MRPMVCIKTVNAANEIYYTSCLFLDEIVKADIGENKITFKYKNDEYALTNENTLNFNEISNIIKVYLGEI